ncbi:MAG: hypothetical protein ACI8W8_004158 [Rhodothermales bacterium]|jgi:hypothetical protein
MPDRREFIRLGLGGPFGAWISTALPTVADSAKNDKAMIVLWMNGGASQTDTFDPKPGHANAGSFKAIGTSAGSKVQICEHLPRIAKLMHHIGLVRSMVSTEGSHERGRFLMHTGYQPLGATAYPSFGSVLAAELGSQTANLPNFVSLRIPSYGSGFLGMTHAPFHVNLPGNVANSKPSGINDERFSRRLNMLKSLERGFVASNRGPEAREHYDVYACGVSFMRSKRLQVFELDDEREAVRDAYGRNPFGDGCLLARRLVESGVKCVEVGLDGWDTHTRGFEKNQELMQVLDPAMSSLIADLGRRRLLDRTLVVCMSEFGRTPNINFLGGRDHFTRAWSAVLAGAGIRGGTVVGQTREDGMEVVDRPHSVPDLFATFCKALDLDPHKSRKTPAGRPIPIVNDGTAIPDFFG